MDSFEGEMLATLPKSPPTQRFWVLHPQHILLCLFSGLNESKLPKVTLGLRRGQCGKFRHSPISAIENSTLQFFHMRPAIARVSNLTCDCSFLGRPRLDWPSQQPCLKPNSQAFFAHILSILIEQIVRYTIHALPNQICIGLQNITTMQDRIYQLIMGKSSYIW